MREDPYPTLPNCCPWTVSTSSSLTPIPDHCALLPALYKYGYDGPVYCTPPTRDLMSLNQLDYIKVSFGEGKKAPYDSSHVREVVAHCIPLKYGETTDIAPDIRLTFQNAGHILGSSVCHFHIGDGLYNIAFTGDMKYERPGCSTLPRTSSLARDPVHRGDLWGYRDHQPSRTDAANNLKEICGTHAEEGGKILIPVFAVGRSQEVMLVLEELMRTGKLPSVPIYLDGLIWEATAIHTAYPEYLNSQLRTQIFQMGQNPFLSPLFKRVETQEMRERISHDIESCIVLSTSGMMNGGPVMEYLKNWADNPQNTLVFVGYQADGTIGNKIQRGVKELTLSERGRPVTVKMKMNIETAEGFSGHSDRRQLMAYIASLDPKPERIIIGHGEEHKCADLASSLYKKFNVETRAPMNLETIRMK